jgi:hypothetical protein
VLVYEPRVEGHHPAWLRFITEDLLSGGFELTLAVDGRPASRQVLEDSLGELLTRVKLLNVFEADGNPRGGNSIRSVALCLEETEASRAFLGEFDEIASWMFRRAALGLWPPAVLRGRVGGITSSALHRGAVVVAKPVAEAEGFQRMLARGWLNPLLFLDEALLRARRSEHPGPAVLPPQPCPPPYRGELTDARRQLACRATAGCSCSTVAVIAAKDCISRPGLQASANHPAFLLCVGRQNPDPKTAGGSPSSPVSSGRPHQPVRFERRGSLSFVASDVVLLPYINHFGISGVLSQAVAAWKPGSLPTSNSSVARRVSTVWDCSSWQRDALRDRIVEATRFSPDQQRGHALAADAYAQRHSRAAYRAALLQAMTGDTATTGNPAREKSG